jgi:hypothetical protein
MRTGALLAIVGVWVLLRSVRRDSTGRTLVDRIVGAKP